LNTPATTDIYTLSLHDALPILLVLLRTVNCTRALKKPPGVHTHGSLMTMPEPTISTSPAVQGSVLKSLANAAAALSARRAVAPRSEEHTSELQSLRHLVCRLLL